MKKALMISASVLAFAILFALTQIPAKRVAADTPSVSSDSEFQLNGTILVKYTGTAQTVSVPASVTEIGAEAFAGNTTMTTLQFKGNNVETIAYRAFSGCSGLREVKLPDSVKTLGDGAFNNCTALEKITFGKNVSRLGINPFSDCTVLRDITVPKENTEFKVEDGCLYDFGKTKLFLIFPGRKGESYTMPATVTDVAEYAFWNCESIKTITLGNGLKKIPDYAFSNAVSLTGITIPYSVSSIGIKAFSGCTNLENVNIHSGVNNIHDTAFDGCKNLKILAEEGSYAAGYYADWRIRNRQNQAEYEDTGQNGIVFPIVVPNGGSSEGTGNQGTDTEGNVLGSTHVVGNNAVVFIDNSNQIVYGSSKENGDNVYGGAGLDNPALSRDTVVPKYTVAFDSIIADQAFYKSNQVSGYQIPEDITEIGEFAFARSNLSRADIPQGVTNIGYGAFYHCAYLREVSIPSTVVSIAPKAFAESMWLKSWLAGTGKEEYLIVGNGILLAYRGDGGNISLPETVKRIAPEAFAGNDSIESVYIPDSVIEIGEDAFCGCKELKHVTGGANVRVIRDRAFKDCPLETAHVWANVEHIGLNCFDFSDISMSISGKIVVFDNAETLPAPCYEVTAERLSNEQARGLLLGDTLFAIVDKGIKADELSGTVLSPDVYGFKGVVAYISSRDKGIVTCIATTYTEEEWLNAYIPEYITIDGKSYQVTGKENIPVMGNKRDYPTGVISVSNESTRLTGNVEAVLDDNNGSYYLRISDSEDAYDSINRGYRAVYDEKLPEGILCVDISLIDEKTGVPVSKTGNRNLHITVTLPSSVAGGELRILTTDRNGQLENLPYTREGDKVTFTTNYLSSFAFCGVVQQPNVYAEFPVTVNR